MRRSPTASIAACLVLALASLSACSPGDASASGVRPPVFDARPYADARAAAAAEGRVLVVKATATWCGPCREMDRTTWRDERVEAWFKEHGIAVAVDVDAEESTAHALGVEAMPTMIAFRNDVEVDRVVGYRSADDLLAWLDGLGRGERAVDLLERKAGPLDAPDGKVDVGAHLRLADGLLRSGSLDRATEEYAWLWQHMLEHAPELVGVRVSFMAMSMHDLAARHEPARRRFLELRNATLDRAATATDLLDVASDIIVLNDVVGDDASTLAWLDGVKGDARWSTTLPFCVFKLRDLLVRNDRWADLGSILHDPVGDFEGLARLQQEVPPGVALDESTLASMRIEAARHAREQAGQDYAALLAAGREDEAERLARRAFERDGSEEMVRSLAATAMTAKQPRRLQSELLAAAETRFPSLRALKQEVDAALTASDAGSPSSPSR